MHLSYVEILFYKTLNTSMLNHLFVILNYNSVVFKHYNFFHSEEEDAATALLNECFAAYCHSPRLLTPDEVEPGTIVVSEEDDMKRLEFARIQVVGTGKKLEVRLYYLKYSFQEK